MPLLKTKPYYSDQELKEILEAQTQIRAFKDWQIIYSVQVNYGKTAEEIAKILGVKKSKIYNIIQNYNKFGKGFRTYDNWGGRRKERCILTLEEEASILKEVEADALKGNILTYRQIKDIVELKVGKGVSDDYIWDLFKRHGWKKKVPRQSHPKANKDEQEEYKKNSKRIWLPSL